MKGFRVVYLVPAAVVFDPEEFRQRTWQAEQAFVWLSQTLNSERHMASPVFQRTTFHRVDGNHPLLAYQEPFNSLVWSSVKVRNDLTAAGLAAAPDIVDVVFIAALDSLTPPDPGTTFGYGWSNGLALIAAGHWLSRVLEGVAHEALHAGPGLYDLHASPLQAHAPSALIHVSLMASSIGPRRLTEPEWARLEAWAGE